MIELLVVIAVLALLITMVVTIASKTIRQQKVRNTRQIMQNVSLALEQFSVQNPLKLTYDRPGAETFGSYPPYALHRAGQSGTVARAVEPSPRGANLGYVSARLALDLGGSAGSEASYVSFGGTSAAPQPNETDSNDDNRALAAYLALFVPEAEKLIPEYARKPLYQRPERGDYVYTNTRNPSPPQPPWKSEGWKDILGIHDAWGVPLDYMLYVKLERKVVATASGERLAWRVVERRPVLRSRGIKREVYEQWVASNRQEPQQRSRQLSPPENWIFSEMLPKPWLALRDAPRYRDGDLPVPTPGGGSALGGGWVRAVGLAEDYAYRPDGDTQP